MHMCRNVCMYVCIREMCVCVWVYIIIFCPYILFICTRQVSVQLWLQALTFPCSLAQLCAALVYIGSLSISKMAVMK